jgi:hypothetical protein
MTILYGHRGTVRVGDAEVAALLKWTLNLISRNVQFVSSLAGQWTRRAPGPRDCTGSLLLHASTEEGCPLRPGQSVVLKLHVDDSGENYYRVPAIVDRISVQTDISGGQPVGYAVEFSGDGQVTPHGILAGE